MKRTVPAVRERNVAHLWADKRIPRFFRRHFDKKDAKNLRNVYFALCEIQSDFAETTKPIRAFRKTLATYAQINVRVAGVFVRALSQGGFLDYVQDRAEDGSFGTVRLLLFEYIESDLEERAARMRRVIETRATWRDSSDSRESSDSRGIRQRRNPLAEESASGGLTPFKNPPNGGGGDKNRKRERGTRVSHTFRRTIPSRSRDESPSVVFARIAEKYPRRAGGNSRVEGQGAFNARVKEKVSPVDLEAAVDRYIKYVAAEGIEGTRYVLQMKSFFGPERRGFEDAWKPSAKKRRGASRAEGPSYPEGEEF